MNMELVPIASLNPAPYNPRIDLQPGDPEYEKLKRSMLTYGCVEPVVANRRTGNIVGGHQRLKVLKELGHTAIEVVWVDLPLEQEKALNVALNKIKGDWDEQKLAVLLEELTATPDLDIELTGFDVPDIDDLLERVLPRNEKGQDDFDVTAALDTTRPAVTQYGDLLELGEHRLLCGDSTKTEDVRRLMDGQRAVLFATDPPYLVNYDGTNHPGRQGERGKNKNWSPSYGITWDDAEANPDLYDKFYAVAVAEAVQINAAWYCWHASRRQSMVEAVWVKHGAFVHQQILWE